MVAAEESAGRESGTRGALKSLLEGVSVQEMGDVGIITYQGTIPSLGRFVKK
jgi:hypothetical protein